LPCSVPLVLQLYGLRYGYIFQPIDVGNPVDEVAVFHPMFPLFKRQTYVSKDMAMLPIFSI
jgi:hypothetical protein